MNGVIVTSSTTYDSLLVFDLIVGSFGTGQVHNCGSLHAGFPPSHFKFTEWTEIIIQIVD